MNVLSLFAGIGGLELGLERLGATTVGQVELDPYCRSVLARHWPEVPQHDDVRTAGEWWTSTPRPTVDVVCGGFPCQPFSSAGLRRGTGDERWGWPWMESVVRLVRPRYVVVENVADLLRHRDAFGLVLSGLAGLGFDAEWCLLPASAVGAPHRRERVFVVADSDRHGREGFPAHHGSGRPLDVEHGDDSHGRGAVDWREWKPAVERWERKLGRRAPEPVVLGARGGQQPNPAFVEWMLGLPAGWATDVPGLSASQILKPLGNAVVPQQCEAALRLLLPRLAGSEQVAA